MPECLMSLANFEHLLKDMIGLDAESIGASAVERAVQERQIACGLEDSLAYWECVQASEPERQLLIEAVVVPETWFFRHREALAAIGHLVQRDWMAAHPEGVCRILSVPCSSGEEPYSIAMALQDVSVPAHRFRIVAVDVSQRVLAQGRRGVYGRNSFRGTDLTFRDRYFTPVADGYHLVDTVRQQVHFEQGNLLSHAFLADAEPYDVIFCRNLLIYFDRPTQERAISALTRLLSPEGFLFVGSSETGLFLNNDFVSARLPMAFAFRRAAATRGKPEADALPPIAHARALRPPAPAPSTAPARKARTTSPAAAVNPVRGQAPQPPSDTAPPASLDEAYRLADQGHFAEAARRCEEHVRQEGPSARALYLLGLVRDASGNQSDAESFYRNALYLDPVHSEALVHLALLMDRQGRYADARVLRNRVRRLVATSKA